MASRKLKIDKCKTLNVICPMSFTVDVETGANSFAQCDANCAWFSTFENDVYCKDHKIGVIDDG